MNTNSEPFKSDNAYKWFTLLGFQGDDLLIFTNNCNAIYADVFEFATVTPVNINLYNKTSQTFFANIAVKQIGETSFEQSDFPVGHSITTATPKFAGLVKGCKQTRMSFKHNGLGSNRGHVVGYVVPDKCPGVRANEFSFDLYTKLVSAITEQNSQTIADLDTAYWMEVRYSTKDRFSIYVHSSFFAKLENLFFLAMDKGDIHLLDGSTAKLGTKESHRAKLEALASDRQVSEDPARTAIIFNLPLDCTSESILKALKLTEKAYNNTPKGTIDRRCDGTLPKFLNDGFGEESISLVKKDRPDGNGRHAFAIFQVASPKVFNHVSLIPIGNFLKGDDGREATFKLKFPREAPPEILSMEGGKGKGLSNNADSFNNPGKKRSVSKTPREEHNISESADKPRKDKAERKKNCDINRRRVSYPLGNAYATAASNAVKTPITNKQSKRKALEVGLKTPPKKSSKLAEKLDTSDESDSDNSLDEDDDSETSSSDEDSDEESEKEPDDDGVEHVDSLPDFAAAEETERSEAAINSPAVQTLRKNVKKVLEENLSTVMRSDTIMALINRAASKAARTQAIATTKEQTALALKPIQDQLTLYAQNFNSMLDAQKFAFQKMTDALKKAKIIVNEVRLDESKLAPALKKIEEMEITAEQKTFLLNLVTENALEQVEIKAFIDSSAIEIMEQEVILGQESLLLTQEKANEAIASANKLALAASQ